ncbi:MAG: lytic murein transglycosylase B [Gammaproteobacteria bacterium]|nr:lytic murein transglycosylase B [Gammaproteobacteria bacterium]
MTPTPFGRRRAAANIAALIAVLAATLLAPAPARSLDTSRPDVQAFIGELVKNDGFEQPYVKAVFDGIESKQSILDAMSRPAEKVKPWFEYREIFITPRRISAGVDFFREHEVRLRQISASTGVPAEVITAILGVETFYGTRTGSFRAVDALATLAFDYPPRSAFFRKELRQLFLLARDEQLDIGTLTGSYAGALGPPQFIPSSYRNFAVDGSGDGRRDLLQNWDDIVASIANYFARHNWQPGQPIATRAEFARDAVRPTGPTELELKDTVGSLARQGVQFTTDLPVTAPAILVTLKGEDGDEYWVGFQNYYAITRYNRSTMYALAVFQLSEAIAAGTRASVAGADGDPDGATGE